MCEAREERQDPNNIAARQCAHPQNVEYALFFAKMQMEAEEAKPDGQWAKTLGRVAYSVCKLPTRVRSLEQANAINGVGPKTLELFRKYLTAYPRTLPPRWSFARTTSRRRRRASPRRRRRRARRLSARRKTRTRTSRRRRRPSRRTASQRQRYDPRGGDDDVIVLDSPRRPPRLVPLPPSLPRPPPAAARGARRLTRNPKTPKRWEPGIAPRPSRSSSPSTASISKAITPCPNRN